MRQDRAAKHDIIQLSQIHDQMMQPDPHTKTKQRADDSQYDAFPVHIRIDLFFRETKDLDRRDLAHALRNIDIAQIVEHHERQGCSRNHKDDHDHPDRADHIQEVFFKSRVKGNALDIRDFHQLITKPGLRFFRSVTQLQQISQSRSLGRFPRFEFAFCHIHLMADIIFENTKHFRAQFFSIQILEMKRVSDIQLHFARHLFRNINTAVFQADRIVTFHRAQSRELIETADLRIRDNMNRSRHFLVIDGQLDTQVLFREHFADIICLLDLAQPGIAFAIQGYRRIHMVDFVILQMHDIRNRIIDPEAGNKQGRTARNSDDRHQKTLLVTENIADRHLMQKRYPIPYSRKPFKKDLFARLAGFRTHELARDLEQLLPDRKEGRQQSDPCYRRAGSQHEARLKFKLYLIDQIHRIPRIENNVREHEHSDRAANDRTKNAGKKSIHQIFHGNLPFGIAQSLQCTDFRTLFIDHTGHGRHAHQCSHKKEEHREDGSDPVHAVSACSVVTVGIQRIPIKHDPFSVQIIDLFLTFTDLLFRFFHFVVQLFLAGLDFLFSRSQLTARRLDLLHARIVLRLGRCELIIGSRQLRVGSQQLGSLCDKLLFLRAGLRQLRKTLFDLSDPAIDLIKSGIQFLQLAFIDRQLCFLCLDLSDVVFDFGLRSSQHVFLCSKLLSCFFRQIRGSKLCFDLSDAVLYFRKLSCEGFFLGGHRADLGNSFLKLCFLI